MGQLYRRKWRSDSYTGSNTPTRSKKLLPTRQSVSYRTQVSINQLTVILRDIVPPIIEVEKLGYAAFAVYSLLYQSAYQDQRYDFRKWVKRKDLKHCGGTTNWSHKAIADILGMGKAKVIASINLLLDNCFIQHEGFMPSSKGSKHREFIELFIPRWSRRLGLSCQFSQTCHQRQRSTWAITRAEALFVQQEMQTGIQIHQTHWNDKSRHKHCY